MNAFSLFGFMRMLGMLPPVEGDTPPAGDGDPVEGTTPPAEGTTPPAEGTTPPAEGTTPPAEGITPPAEGITPPAEGDTPPAEGTAPPAEGDTPPAEGDTPPAEGDTPPADAMQEILNSFRADIQARDSELESLAKSVQTLADTVQTAQARSTSIPYRGWRYWKYPVSVDYGTMEGGAGSWDDVTETCDTPQDFENLYTWLDGMFNDGVFDDWNIWKIYNGGTTLFEFGKPVAPPAEVTLPFDGSEGWSYPVTVDYTVTPWGAAETECTQTFDTADAFRQEYSDLVYACGDGGGLKDFCVRYIRDNSGTTVYSYETEEPPEDLTPAILETLQTMDARLEYLNAALDDLSSVSGNSIAYYEDSVKLYRQSNELLTHTLAVDLALFCIVVVLLGHSIAHAFWERMRVG